MSAQLWRVSSQSGALLYGVDEGRCPAPVPAGSRVSLRQQLVDAEPAPSGGWRVSWRCVIELENSPKPACVATVQSLLFE
jgi:acyl dehydratase